MASTERHTDPRSEALRNRRRAQGDETLRHQELLFDETDEGDGRTWESSVAETPAPFTPGELQEEAGAQADFREQFDEDLYTDREDPPAQGNTADVAMGERRFGSDGEAYAEYAHRRPGEESSVGVSRDPADIAAEDDEQS